MTDNDCKTLAAAVIKQGIADLNTARRNADYNKSAAADFFKGEWFECLAEIVGLNPEAVRSKLKLS